MSKLKLLICFCLLLVNTVIAKVDFEVIEKLTPVEKDLEKITWMRFQSSLRKVMKQVERSFFVKSSTQVEVLNFKHTLIGKED